MGKTPKKKARERLAEREKGTRKGERACNHFFSDPLPRGGWGGYSHTLPIRVRAAQRGRDFEAPNLERGIHFRGVF